LLTSHHHHHHLSTYPPISVALLQHYRSGYAKVARIKGSMALLTVQLDVAPLAAALPLLPDTPTAGVSAGGSVGRSSDPAVQYATQAVKFSMFRFGEFGASQLAVKSRELPPGSQHILLCTLKVCVILQESLGCFLLLRALLLLCGITHTNTHPCL
jgi:hypothetical protein